MPKVRGLASPDNLAASCTSLELPNLPSRLHMTFSEDLVGLLLLNVSADSKSVHFQHFERSQIVGCLNLSVS